MEAFETYRPLLFSIAYRMLGSAMEAEDIVQEAYLRCQAAQPESVDSPKAYLSTIVTRLCLDHMKSAQQQRETYIGPWLPEPMLTGELPARQYAEYESISMAFLVLLESLSPPERAVFLLREVFDYDYDEIGSIIGKTESACRQLFSRAKKHITDNRPRYNSSPEEHRSIVERFLKAAEVGDLNGLTNLLAENVVMWSDGGGKASAATRPLHGREKVAKMLNGLSRFLEPGMRLEVEDVNGQPALIIRHADGQPIVVTTFDVHEGRIQAVRNIRNPDKLKHI